MILMGFVNASEFPRIQNKLKLKNNFKFKDLHTLLLIICYVNNKYDNNFSSCCKYLSPLLQQFVLLDI